MTADREPVSATRRTVIAYGYDTLETLDGPGGRDGDDDDFGGRRVLW